MVYMSRRDMKLSRVSSLDPASPTRQTQIPPDRAQGVSYDGL